MSDKMFMRVLAAVLVLGVLVTAGMVAYTAYLHANCSIIGFIASER